VIAIIFLELAFLTELGHVEIRFASLHKAQRRQHSVQFLDVMRALMNALAAAAKREDCSPVVNMVQGRL
jgi:hypothetical protein